MDNVVVSWRFRRTPPSAFYRFRLGAEVSHRETVSTRAVLKPPSSKSDRLLNHEFRITCPRRRAKTDALVSSVSSKRAFKFPDGSSSRVECRFLLRRRPPRGERARVLLSVPLPARPRRRRGRRPRRVALRVRIGSSASAHAHRLRPEKNNKITVRRRCVRRAVRVRINNYYLSTDGSSARRTTYSSTCR